MAQEHNIKPQSNAMIKTRVRPLARADDSSELEELKGKSTESSTSEIDAGDLEEPFDNDECEDAESGGSLAPLHIESAASNYTCTSRMCPCRRSRSFLPSFICQRALLALTVSTLLTSLVLAIAKHLYPTYLPSVPSVSIFGGISSSHADAACLSLQLPKSNLTTVDRLSLNRRASAFGGIPTNLKGAKGGFLWQEGDAKTTKWRPQGISTLVSGGGKRFVLVSWYGRKDEGYADRGARISFVDVTKMHSIAAKYPYRHVLLVDENFCTFPNIHAGGIEVTDNHLLHVADSRKGQQGIRVFDIARNLFEVPVSLQSNLFGYRYVLQSSSFFHVPTKPSFIGNDPDHSGMLLVGTYSHCGNAIGMHVDSESCMNRPDNRLVWLEDGTASMTWPKPCSPFFSEMQGAVSAQLSDNTTTLIVASSYGPYADSHLHIVNNFDRLACKMPSDSVTEHFPAGLEDLHIAVDPKSQSRFLWALTEFGTRMVFVTPLTALGVS